MNNTSFVYDPLRQGFDANSWVTLSGNPKISNLGRLQVDPDGTQTGVISHYADILKGDITFNVNVPADPALDSSSIFGLYSPASTAYIVFTVNRVLTCDTSDGGSNTTHSATIAWDSANWTAQNVNFRIIWEAGMARFLINNVQVYSVSDSSVPYGPLSLYVYDSANLNPGISIGSIAVLNAQSLLFNLKTTGTPTPVGGGLFTSSKTTVSEAITMVMTPLISLFDSTVTSENISVTMTPLISLFDSTVTSENISVTMTPLISLFDSTTTAEGLTVLIPTLVPSLFESTTTSEGVTVLIPILKFVPIMYDNVIVSENFAATIA